MRRFALTLARLCPSMWVGAALLFVATSVTEQVQPSFDTMTKDTLALIRFPWYYGTGATLLGVGLAATLVAARRTRAMLVPAGLVAAALVVLAADYAFVYLPLRDLMTPVGTPRTPEFERLHGWSERLNVAGFLLSAAAAIIACAIEPKEERS